MENYVDVPTFLEACKACPNYDRVWACPSYDFDVLKYWKQYQTFQLLATEITFDEDMLAKEYSRQEIQISWIRFCRRKRKNSATNCCALRN